MQLHTITAVLRPDEESGWICVLLFNKSVPISAPPTFLHPFVSFSDDNRPEQMLPEIYSFSCGKISEKSEISFVLACEWLLRDAWKAVDPPHGVNTCGCDSLQDSGRMFCCLPSQTRTGSRMGLSET